MKKMNSKSVPFKETLYLAIGELTVSALVIAVFLIIKKFELSVLFGALLGSAVIIINFLILSISVNRAIDKALENAPKSLADKLSGEAAHGEVANAESESKAEDDINCEDSDSDDTVDANDEKEDEPDEAEIFAKKYALTVQNSVKISYIARTLSMLAALVVAFIIPGVFNVIATVIPMLLFRPILMIENYIRNRKAK